MTQPTPIKHVLVADDYPLTAELLALGLEAELAGAITIDYAIDGRQALRMGLARPPAVAILDINMPGMSGWAVGDALRLGPGGAAMLLIAVTANPADVIAPADRLFDHVLSKPADVAALAALIRAA